MESPYQSDNMRSARDVCEGISNKMIQYYIFHIMANMGFYFLVMTKHGLLMSTKKRKASRDGLAKLREGAFIICNIVTL